MVGIRLNVSLYLRVFERSARMHYEFKRLKNRIFGLLFFIAVASPFPASAQSNEPSVEDTLAWIASVLGHGSASASQIEPNGDICFKGDLCLQ